jgi:6-pyruvoyl-tetrahydropterin synthase
MISSITQISSKKHESTRLRSLLGYVPRFQGKAYSIKLNINYENNNFNCKATKNITPKEFTFLSSAAYSICSDKIYENFELLAQKINSEVDAQLDQKLILNVNFLNDFKQVLFFAYNLAYTIDADKHKGNKTVSDSFFDKIKVTFTQAEILDNLPIYNFNLLEFSNEDSKILNQYLHTVMDININQVTTKINSVVDNIEKALKGNQVYKRWLEGNSAQIRQLIGIVWANAMNLNFE